MPAFLGDWAGEVRATLNASYQPQVSAMLLNRLSTPTFSPPTNLATSGVTVASSAADDAQPAVGSGMGVAGPEQAGVLLHLDSNRKTASSGTYTKGGLFSDTPRTSPLTPAEEFVAAAVVNLRNYDQAKVNAASDAASRSGQGEGLADAAQRGRFDSIKQAVSKLYASA